MNYDMFRQEKMVALKEKDTFKNKVLTNLLSQLLYQKKELDRELEEKEIVAILRKMIKQSQETLSLSKGRPEQEAEIEKEIALLKAYLPEELSREKILEVIEKLAKENNIEKSPQSKGKLMPLLMKNLGDRSDGKTISEVLDVFLKS